MQHIPPGRAEPLGGGPDTGDSALLLQTPADITLPSHSQPLSHTQGRPPRPSAQLARVGHKGGDPPPHLAPASPGAPPTAICPGWKADTLPPIL